MTDAVKAVARAICTSLGEGPDAADTPYEIRGWRLHCSTARAAIAVLRDSPGLEEACRRAADPKSGEVCWVGVSVHRAADIVDAVLAAALGETEEKTDG